MGGIFGVARHGECAEDLFYGTDYLSHLGTKRGGMAVFGPSGVSWKIHRLESSYFRTKMEPGLSSFSGNIGIGAISDYDAQPLTFTSHLGNFAIASVGRIINEDELVAEATRCGGFFSGSTTGRPRPTEILAMLLSSQQNFEDGIRLVHEKIKGSCTFVIMTKEGIYACRDKLGRTPLTLGKKDEGFALSSESSAFQNLGYQTVRDLGPGEALFVSPDGYETRVAPGTDMQVCSFLWVYYGYPSSTYEGVNVEEFRYRCGACLGRNDDVQVDFVGGIPDSGIGHAVGYANERRMPYRRPVVKYTPTWPRSFMPQNQASRALVAKMKLILNRSLIEGRSMVFLDDSIVRGTQLNDNARMLFEYGAKEVHMRIACPVLVYPCEYLNFSTSRSALELIGLKAIMDLEGDCTTHIRRYVDDSDSKNADMVEWIRKKLSLTSLKFQKLDDLVEAIGLPREKLCTHCFDGSSRGHE